MLRNYLESCSGIVTGSDFLVTLPFFIDQMRCEFGCQVVDDTVWVIKSHDPIPVAGKEQQFHSSRSLVIVRNPLECYPSYMNLMTHCSHALTSNEPLNSFVEEWDESVKLLTAYAKQYYETLIKVFRDRTDMPFHIVRFEDLRRDTYETMTEVFRFLLNAESLEGTVLDQIL